MRWLTRRFDAGFKAARARWLAHLRRDMPAAWVTNASLRAEEPGRYVFAVFFGDPEVPDVPGRYRLVAVDRAGHTVEDLETTPDSPTGSGGPPELMAAGQWGPNSIAVDANAVYWSAIQLNDKGPLGRIRSRALKGGAVVDLATPLNNSLLALRGPAVYFTDALAGKVYRASVRTRSRWVAMKRGAMGSVVLDVSICRARVRSVSVEGGRDAASASIATATVSSTRNRQTTRRTRKFKLQITGLNLSPRVPTPSVEPRSRLPELFLQLRKTYGLQHA